MEIIEIKRIRRRGTFAIWFISFVNDFVAVGEEVTAEEIGQLLGGN